jgi:hypothetical protein
LALLFGVRSMYTKVVTEAMKPQPIPEMVALTPVLPIGTFTPLIFPTPFPLKKSSSMLAN